MLLRDLRWHPLDNISPLPSVAAAGCATVEPTSVSCRVLAPPPVGSAVKAPGQAKRGHQESEAATQQLALATAVHRQHGKQP